MDVSDKGQKTLENRRVAELNIEMHRFTIFCLLCGLAVPIATQNGDRGCQDKLGDEYLDYEHVHFLLNIAQLVAAKLRIHHNARFLARVDDETDDPLGVFQLSSLQ